MPPAHTGASPVQPLCAYCVTLCPAAPALITSLLSQNNSKDNKKDNNSNNSKNRMEGNNMLRLSLLRMSIYVYSDVPGQPFL